MEEWEGLKWVGMKNEELEVGGGGEIHGRWGGRCDDDGVRCMIMYLSYNICVSAYVVCL